MGYDAHLIHKEIITQKNIPWTIKKKHGIYKPCFQFTHEMLPKKIINININAFLWTQISSSLLLWIPVLIPFCTSSTLDNLQIFFYTYISFSSIPQRFFYLLLLDPVKSLYSFYLRLTHRSSKFFLWKNKSGW